MTDRPTWAWVRESLFPLVVKEARAAGLTGTRRWALDSRSGPGVMWVLLDDQCRTVERVLCRFRSPTHAVSVFEGCRVAWHLTREQ